jgi:hypothetical protein
MVVNRLQKVLINSRIALSASRLNCQNIFVFRIKISIRISKTKYVFAFDSLALKPLGLYVNLVGHLVAYSQPFNLVYR